MMMMMMISTLATDIQAKNYMCHGTDPSTDIDPEFISDHIDMKI